jgi:hypothetical protein
LQGKDGEAAPVSPKPGDFKARIIGSSGGYRNLAMRGKKGGGAAPLCRPQSNPLALAELYQIMARITCTGAAVIAASGSR